MFYSIQAHMSFPSGYPYSPPTFRFLTKMWHPNIYEVRTTLSLRQFIFWTISSLILATNDCCWLSSLAMCVFRFYIPRWTIHKVANYLQNDGTQLRMLGAYKYFLFLSVSNSFRISVNYVLEEPIYCMKILLP